MFYNKIVITSIFFLITIQLFSQKDFMVFGSINKDQFEINEFKGDSSVSAILLGEYKNIRFNTCLDLLMDYHVRILVVNESGFSYANQKFLIHKNQEFFNFRAETYNLENDEIISTSITKENVYNQGTNRDFNTMSFAMPNVKKGSIIEYKFTVGLGHFFYLKPQFFQKEIPVIRSDLYITISDYILYNFTMLGFSDVKYTKTSQVTDFCGANYKSKVHYWRADSLIQLKEEIYSNNIENFRVGVQFNFFQINVPKYYNEYFFISYDDVSNKLLSYESFGLRYKNLLFTKDIIKKLQLDSLQQIEKIQKIFEYVQNYMTWNGTYEVFCAFPLKGAFTEKKGSVAEINLLLCALLHEANIKANPVILASRQSIKINKFVFTPLHFDYVIVQAIIDGQSILMDATEKNIPIGRLPFRCLNGEGLVIDKGISNWVALLQKEMYSKTIICKYQIESTKIVGNLQIISKNLSASKKLNEIENQGGVNNYVKSLKNIYNNYNIINVNIEHDTIVKDVVKESITFEHKQDIIPNKAIVLSSFIQLDFLENAFNVTERFLPIDFGCPFEYTYITNIVIPENYDIKQMPQSQVIVLPNNLGEYSLMIKRINNTLQCVVKIKVSNILFFPQEVNELKQFYDFIIEGLQTRIYLEKI